MAITIVADETRTPFYTTSANVIANDQAIADAIVAAEITVSDVDDLIIMAETYIDYLVGFHKKFFSKFCKSDDDWQRQFTIFPRDIDVNVDENPYIPDDIVRATVTLVGLLYKDIFAQTSTTLPAGVSDILDGGGSLRMHGFAVSKSSDSSVARFTSAKAISAWLSKTPKGRMTLARLSKYTNFTGKR